MTKEDKIAKEDKKFKEILGIAKEFYENDLVSIPGLMDKNVSGKIASMAINEYMKDLGKGVDIDLVGINTEEWDTKFTEIKQAYPNKSDQEIRKEALHSFVRAEGDPSSRLVNEAKKKFGVSEDVMKKGQIPQSYTDFMGSKVYKGGPTVETAISKIYRGQTSLRDSQILISNFILAQKIGGDDLLKEVQDNIRKNLKKQYEGKG